MVLHAVAWPPAGVICHRSVTDLSQNGFVASMQALHWHSVHHMPHIMAARSARASIPVRKFTCCQHWQCCGTNESWAINDQMNNALSTTLTSISVILQRLQHCRSWS